MGEIIEYFKRRLEIKKTMVESYQKEIVMYEKFIAELERTNSNCIEGNPDLLQEAGTEDKVREVKKKDISYLICLVIAFFIGIGLERMLEYLIKLILF